MLQHNTNLCVDNSKESIKYKQKQSIT